MLTTIGIIDLTDIVEKHHELAPSHVHTQPPMRRQESNQEHALMFDQLGGACPSSIDLTFVGRKGVSCQAVTGCTATIATRTACPTATAASLHNAQGQFFITDQYQTNPTSAVLHNRSTLSAADGNGIGMVLYFERILLASGWGRQGPTSVGCCSCLF